MNCKKGERLAEGKTKCIYADADNPECVIVENKSAITAHDDPKFTRKFDAKAVYATATTCRVFELLNACGVPTSFIEQISETEFRAQRSKMIGLECVARRLAVGSYLMRHPELLTADPKKPHIFHALLTEFFLKTTGRKHPNLEAELPCDDPLIANPDEDNWKLMLPKTPDWKLSEDGKKMVPCEPFACLDRGLVLPESMGGVDGLRHTLRRAFYVLEKAWGILGLTLVDFKLEFDELGNISDVVDNDSWRLWKNGEAFDKQVFRDGGESVLDEVEKKYGYIARLAERLAVPKQALVFWRGSKSDWMPDLPPIPGISNISVVLSGHKRTHECLAQLEGLFTEYPQGGVIVTNVGLSNGLGPILAAHSHWPVISCVQTKEAPKDAWSALSMPSQVPLLAINGGNTNAFEAALRILALNNPAAYCYCQERIEDLEGYVV